MSEHDELTPRQREVLELVAKGHTNGEIAAMLGISLDGAKWHVSELLARLAVDTRDEAAEWWHSDRSFRRRVSRTMRAFRMAPTLGGVVFGGGALVVALVAAVVFLAHRGENPPVAASVIATATPTPFDTPTATPATLATAVPDGPVGFKVCGQVTNYRNFTVAEMQSIFTNRRFGDGVKPGPFYWAMYLSQYYWITDPHAVSAIVEDVALSGAAVMGGPLSLPDAPASCGPPRQDERYQSLWIYNHHVTQMSASAGLLTVQVEPTTGTLENVQFPDSPLHRSLPPDKNAQVAGFAQVRIVDRFGHLLTQRGGGNEWEFEDDGNLVSAFLGSGPIPTLRVPIDLELLCDARAQASTNITIQRAGELPSKITTAACTGAWNVAASIHLDPGDWTISIDGNVFYTALPKGGRRP